MKTQTEKRKKRDIFCLASCGAGLLAFKLRGHLLGFALALLPAFLTN
jgi:hypothetical protein